MIASIKKQLEPKKFKEAEIHQSAGILDDFAVRKNVATRAGTIEKVPANNNDIANKKYVDDVIVSHSHVLSDGATDVTASAAELNYTDGVTSAIQTQIDNANPVGRIVMYGGSTAPTGWLLCNNSAVSRTTYAALFTVISTTFGVGDGSTTFNVPDMRGIFPRGAGTSAKLTNANGSAFAGTLGTYQNDKMQGHFHDFRSKAMTNTIEGTIATFDVDSIPTASWNGAATHIEEAITDGTNGVSRTGAETNPANLGVTFIIKF